VIVGALRSKERSSGGLQWAERACGETTLLRRTIQAAERYDEAVQRDALDSMGSLLVSNDVDAGETG
jgi:hypothetical protein